MNKDVERILNENATALAESAVVLALRGNTSMLKLCLDKLAPQASLVQLQLMEQIKSIEKVQYGIAERVEQ